MIAALDVDYRAEAAVAACVLFPDWGSDAVTAERVEVVREVRGYVPGQFYLRELPALIAVLRRVREPLEAVVIDGYVWLDASERPGLGAHLIRALGEEVPVVGVAKRAFAGSPHAMPIVRGQSRRPLYVTSAGIEPGLAADLVARMHGAHRIPTMLQRVDRLARSARLS